LGDGDRWNTDIVVVAITSAGEIAGAIRLPNAYVTDHYRKLLVTPAGDVLQMQTFEDEVRFIRWTLREGGSEGGSR
jgi:hypothetical protein